MRRAWGLGLLVGVLLAAPVRAEAARDVAHLRRLSVVLAPLKLISPVLEAQAELRVGNLFGVGAALGLGRVTVELETDEEDRWTVVAAAQASWYAIGHFERGLLVAADVRYVGVTGEPLGGEPAGLAVGPLVGFKLVVASGFTVVARAGMSIFVLDPADGDRELDGNLGCDACVANVDLGLGYTF